MTDKEIYKFKLDFVWHKEVDYCREHGKAPSVKETRKWIKQARKEVQKLVEYSESQPTGDENETIQTFKDRLVQRFEG